MFSKISDRLYTQKRLNYGFSLNMWGCIPGPHDFAFVSGFAFHSGCSRRMLLHLSPTCLALVSHSGRSGPHAVAFISACLPLVSHSGSHSGCSGPHAFTLVCHLSPTLVSHSGWSGSHDFTLVSHTCLPHLSPNLGARGRMILHLSPTCFPVWAVWAA